MVFVELPEVDTKFEQGGTHSHKDFIQVEVPSPPLFKIVTVPLAVILPHILRPCPTMYINVISILILSPPTLDTALSDAWPLNETC